MHRGSSANTFVDNSLIEKVAGFHLFIGKLTYNDLFTQACSGFSSMAYYMIINSKYDLPRGSYYMQQHK